MNNLAQPDYEIIAGLRRDLARLRAWLIITVFLAMMVTIAWISWVFVGYPVAAAAPLQLAGAPIVPPGTTPHTRIAQPQISWPSESSAGTQITPAILDLVTRAYAWQFADPPQHSTAACTYGQAAVDDRYFYWCVPNRRYHEEGQPLYRWLRIPIEEW